MQHNNQIQRETEHINSVTSIPGDEVCVVNFAGVGIKDDELGRKLGHFIANDVLQGFNNVANYFVVYNFGFESESQQKILKIQRQIVFDKYKQNIILPKPTTTEENLNLYITEKNFDAVFRRVVAPLLKEKSNLTIKYIVDGDIPTIKSLLDKNLAVITKKLNFTPTETINTIRLHKRNVFSYQKYYVPEYLDMLFEKILLPRITDDNGKRLPIDTAKRRIRKITFLAHCHGGYVVLMMEEKLKSKMQDLGYSQDEINQILSQMLTIVLNPACPLGVAKSKFISFMSMYDNTVDRPRNWISEYIQNLKNKRKNLKPGFLTDTNGNVFFVNNRFGLLRPSHTPSFDEHNNAHFFNENLTSDGKMLMNIAHNIVISGIKNSLMQDSKFTPLPEIDELILDGKQDKKWSKMFDKMKQNGNDFMTAVYKYATKSIKSNIFHSKERL